MGGQNYKIGVNRRNFIDSAQDSFPCFLSLLILCIQKDLIASNFITFIVYKCPRIRSVQYWISGFNCVCHLGSDMDPCVGKPQTSVSEGKF